MRKITAALACVLLLYTISFPIFAATYFPDVSEEMSTPAYWSSRQENPDSILAAAEEIERLNSAAASEEATQLVDLRELPETFDGPEENEKALQAERDNKEEFIGWTYDGDGNELTEEDFDALIAACDDPNAVGEMTVRYAVAAVRTHLLIYPTDIQILDDPADPDFDYRYNTAVRLGEPLLIYTASADGRWYNARSVCYAGWVKAEDVAICSDRAEWLSAWDFPEERTLVVYGDKVFTEDSNYAPETAGRMLTMGTTLELAEPETSDALVGNRVTWHNYMVYLPVRQEDGSYRKQAALISTSKKVHAGYLPLTKANIVSVAFEALGDVYGWGGMLQADDCSGYIRNIYKCFGLELARNTTWQACMPVANMDLSHTANEEKRFLLDQLPLGAVLYFNGHEMLYLGNEDGKYYVVNSVSSMLNPWDNTMRQRVRGVVITTLDARRPNGSRWLTELNYVNVPYYSPDVELAVPKWYHEGVAFCLEQKLMDTLDGEFHVDDAAKRWEIVEALWRIMGEPEPEHETSFADISADAPYAEAVRWAASEEIVAGTAETTFAPDAELTREQAAVILYRFAVANAPESVAALTEFADSAEISDWALEALDWAVDAGIMCGSDGFLRPKDAVTRAEAAQLIYHYAEQRAA